MRIRDLDSRPGLVRTAKALRKLLPGDHDYGDPLSVGGSEPPHLIGQRLAAITADRPSALREAGLSAVQVWQALSEMQGRGRGEQEMAILFTDLVGFSDWALEVGDEQAVELLRQVGKAVEPPIRAHDGTIVKRLGDGLMAVFEDAGRAVEASVEAASALDGVEVEGYRPQLRVGVHVGRPRKLGGDYFGVDVNTAARVMQAAGPNELLISEIARKRVDPERLGLSRRWRFTAKGAPKDLKVYAAELRPPSS